MYTGLNRLGSPSGPTDSWNVLCTVPSAEELPSPVPESLAHRPHDPNLVRLTTACLPLKNSAHCSCGHHRPTCQ
jgi:hypothetical protein